VIGWRPALLLIPLAALRIDDASILYFFEASAALLKY